MNLYFTAVIVRRLLATGIAIGAVFFGHSVLQNAQQDSVNHSIDHAQKSVDESVARAQSQAPQIKLPKDSAHVKTAKNGDFSVSGGGTKVTVKGLPTAGQ